MLAEHAAQQREKPGKSGDTGTAGEIQRRTGHVAPGWIARASSRYTALPFPVDRGN
jgi:hypothetical protein